MVEAAAEKLTQWVGEFLTKASRKGSEESEAPEYQITQYRKSLDFLEGKWVEGAEARTRTRSVEEGIQQQIELVGSKAIYDRVCYHLARLDISSDPYFIREQLLLFKWRVEFIAKFFPIEAAVRQYMQGLFAPEPSPGWWYCFGAGGLPDGPGGGDFYPEFALAGMAFDFVLHQAYHMGENIVNFNDAWDPLPSEIRGGDKAFATVGGDYDYKYWLFYEDPAHEEHAFKWVHSVDEETCDEGDGMPLAYLERVVMALHRQGPPSLTHLAIKRVIELELPQDELPEEVKDMITEGPDVKLSEITERGKHLLEVLRQKEIDDIKNKVKEDLYEEAERGKLEERRRLKEEDDMKNKAQEGLDEEAESDDISGESDEEEEEFSEEGEFSEDDVQLS